MMVDYAHILISIPLKYAVAIVIGYIKVKSAIDITHNYLDIAGILQVSIFGPKIIMFLLWAAHEQVVREFIKTQEKEDRRIDRQNLFK